MGGPEGRKPLYSLGNLIYGLRFLISLNLIYHGKLIGLIAPPVSLGWRFYFDNILALDSRAVVEPIPIW